MNKSIAYVAAVAALVACVLITYYRSRPTSFKPDTVPAEGVVLVGGKPKAGVRVTYHPQFDIGAIKFTPNGTTNAEGKFTLGSGRPGDGAPRGEYVVTFEFLVLRSGGIEEEIDLFKGKYSNPATSRWKVKVEENSLEHFQLD